MEKHDDKKIKDNGLMLRKNLIDLMKQKKLSMAQVAKLAGTKKSVIYSWSIGAVPHDLHAVRRLALALQISLTALLFGEEEDFAQNTTQLPQTITGVYRVTLTKLDIK